MQVRETTIRGLIGGERQFRVPIFQRRYDWSTKELTRLWADVLGQYAELTAGPAGSTHFLGSFVLMPESAAFTRPVPSAILVDGQQRLLSILLLLAAIRDAAGTTDPAAVAGYDQAYLRIQGQSGDSASRFLPTPPDRASFSSVIDHDRVPVDLIGAAYRYFAGQIDAGDDTGQTLDLDRLTQATVDRLAIVDITTDAADNPYRIFESINATGKSLTQADLLRNYVFMRMPKSGESMYAKTWRPMEDLVGVANLEALARVDLQCRGEDVAGDDVYRLQRGRLALFGEEAQITEVIRELAGRAAVFRLVLEPSEAPVAVRASLERLTRWGAQSAYPLLVLLLERLRAHQDEVTLTRQAIEFIESYLVRRYVVGLTTTGLTRLFIQVGRDLEKAADPAAAVQFALSEPPAYWPTDQEVRDAIHTRPFYLTGRPAQHRFILDRLEESYKAAEPVDLAKAKLSIEHILPQSLTPEWREHLQALDDDPDDVHANLVHTLGNLTLTAFNGTLSNHPLERKRQIYEGSHLAMTVALHAADRWGSAEIRARGQDLANRAIHVWPGPIRTDQPETDYMTPAFWRPLETLIARIPRGFWASHADIGTAANVSQAWVGRHLLNVPGLPGHERAILDPLSPSGLAEPSQHRLRAEGAMRLDGSLDAARRLGVPQLEDLRAHD